MIMFAGHSIVDLSGWHSWWPWVPIQLTESWQHKCGPWRWLFIIERRRVYDGEKWIRDEYRDVAELDIFVWDNTSGVKFA